jgi:tetratricopeptide (TPR) repeat protein
LPDFRIATTILLSAKNLHCRGMPDALSSASLRGVVAFTGRLASMKREEAFVIVRERGGSPRRGVTRNTTLLIVGEEGWPLLVDGRPSNSLRRAKELGIAIVGERRFLEWIGRAVPDEQQRSYDARRLSALAGLPEGVIEQLSIFGLIGPREGGFGFRDLAAARQVAELLAAGVSLSTITKSLREIRKWLPDAGLASVKLYPKSADALLVTQLGGLTDKQGQFVLPVSDPEDNADLLFEEAQAAEDAQDMERAERLYRRVIKIDPTDAAAAFNLGNLLRGAGRAVEAEAAFRRATKSDPRFAEAWYNLADLLDDQGRTGEAVECLKRALEAAPDYADAIFNLATLLQRLEQHTEAADYWRRYLASDSDSPWAARARRALKYCEMVGRAQG